LLTFAQIARSPAPPIPPRFRRLTCEKFTHPTPSPPASSVVFLGARLAPHLQSRYGFEVMLRWLLTLCAALILLGSSVSAWAAAGFVGESECCCPVKAECRCHDHEGKPAPAPLVKKCGGQAELIAPAVIPAVQPSPPRLYVSLQLLELVPPLLPAFPDPPTYEPETPPF
jgi:hypothetical protein